MDKIDGAMIFMACALFLAIVVLADYESFERGYGAPKTPMDNLTSFLADDQTSDRVYDFDDYHCVHFSIALTENLTDAGYNATPVILATSRPGEWSHMVVSVNLGNETVYVEPQYDVIFPPSEWDDELALGDRVRVVNISVAKSMRS